MLPNNNVRTYRVSKKAYQVTSRVQRIVNEAIDLILDKIII